MQDVEELGRVKVSIEVTIRPCIEADLPALEWMGLYARDRDIIRQAFEAQQRGDGLMLLGISAGFPVAQVWIDFVRRRGQGAAYLWAIRTFYPLQGTGIGRHMMGVTEAVLRKRGIERAELGVEKDNHRAIRFYERLGWQTVGSIDEEIGCPGGNGTVTTERLEQWLMTKELASPGSPWP